jgi:hypothetical protein
VPVIFTITVTGTVSVSVSLTAIRIINAFLQSCADILHIPKLEETHGNACRLVYSGTVQVKPAAQNGQLDV